VWATHNPIIMGEITGCRCLGAATVSGHNLGIGDLVSQHYVAYYPRLPGGPI